MPERYPPDDSLSDTPIHQRLSSIFPDAIVLDMHYTVKAVSSSILHLLKYSENDVLGKKVSFLSQDAALEDQLRDNLALGFFQDLPAKLRAGCERNVMVNISGFYFHLLNGIGGYIVLKVRSLEELQIATTKLQQKTEELEYFIYRASHDLRGPIATIKGLINLANMRKDDNEVDTFFDLISIHAEKLDQELRDLVNKIQPGHHL